MGVPVGELLTIAEVLKSVALALQVDFCRVVERLRLPLTREMNEILTQVARLVTIAYIVMQPLARLLISDHSSPRCALGTLQSRRMCIITP